MTDRATATRLFVVALGIYVWFYGGWGANQEANYALTRALVEARQFHIDEFTVPDGDVARGVGGHLYSNKAPGLSFLGAIPYAPLFFAQRAKLIEFDDYWRTNKRLVTAATSGVLGAATVPLLFLYCRRRWPESRPSAVLAALSVAFGTILFPYATMYFAHAASAFFLLLSFVLVPRRPFIAGAAAGVGTLCFYLTGLTAVVLAVFALTISVRSVARFVAGGIPFALILGIYHQICFGSPFTTAVERSTGFTEEGRAFGVFGRIRMEALAGITISEYRGLLISSPVIILALIGLVSMIRRHDFTAADWTIAAIVLMFLWSIASFNGWHGGYAFGPRYLLPVVPLLAVWMAALRSRWWWTALLVVSAAINLLAAAVDPMTPENLRTPISSYLAPAFLGEKLTPELQQDVLSRCESNCDGRRVGLAQDGANLGELTFGRGSAASVIPAVIWMLAGAWWTLRSASSRETVHAEARRVTARGSGRSSHEP